MARPPPSRLQARQRAGLWFVLPALAVYLLFFGLPFAATLWLSFTEWNGVGVPDFTGAVNYLRLVRDPAMWAALGNNMIWVVIGTAVPIAAGRVDFGGLISHTFPASRAQEAFDLLRDRPGDCLQVVLDFRE